MPSECIFHAFQGCNAENNSKCLVTVFSAEHSLVAMPGFWTTLIHFCPGTSLLCCGLTLLVIVGGFGSAPAQGPSAQPAWTCDRPAPMPLPPEVERRSGPPLKGAQFYRMAWFHLNAGDAEKAFRQFDQAIEVDPDNALFYLGRGVAFAHTKNSERTLQEFERAVNLDPRYSKVYLDAAHVYLSSVFLGSARIHLTKTKRAFDLAFQDADEAIKHYGANSGAHLTRGAALNYVKEHDRAIESLGEAIKLDPACHWAFQHRANSFAIKQEYDRALADFDRLMEFEPSRATADNLSAFVHSRRADYTNAMRDLNDALKLNPKYAVALNNRCEIRTILGALDEALVDCEESLRIEPNAAHTLDSRAVVHLMKGELDKAIADFDAALRINPTHAHALYGCGIARRLTGDAAGGEADVAAAQASNAKVAAEYDRYGLQK